MNQKRISQLEKTGYRIISEYISQELPEVQAEFGLINLSSVTVSSDISYLDAHVSSIKNTELLTKTLAKYARDMERKLIQAVAIRKLPRIRFRYDSS
jgi:ribosome-binding factor A